MLIQDFILIGLGLVGLYFGGEWLVRSTSRFALSISVSPLLIAISVVAIGTSMPELLVSITSATQGIEGIAVGNVIGSNIANIGLVLGVSGLIAPILIQPNLLWRQIPIMILCTLVVIILSLDGILDRIDGLLLLLGFAAFNAYVYILGKQEHENRKARKQATDEHDSGKEVNRPAEFAILVAGVIALIIGANLLVEGAKNVAEFIGVPDIIIGITLVALGTSLPELAASLSAARHQKMEIVIGNVIGSNVTNLLLILGATSVILPIHVMNENLIIEQETILGYIMMTVFAVSLLVFGFNRVISKLQSTIFLVMYIVFILYTVFIAPAAG